METVMNRKLAIFLLVLITVDFAVLSAYAMMQHGYIGLFTNQFTNSAGWQVLADLVIVCLLAMVWMVADARRSGRVVWPYLVATLLTGSFGPLAYLLIGLLGAPARRPVLLAGAAAR
jgi:hypothetical protein